MHFFSRRNASLALSLAAVGVLAACGDDVTVPIAPPAPVVVSVTPQAVTLNPGSTATLSVQISGGDPTPTLDRCVSGTPGVATAVAANGACTVTAAAAGSTTITAITSAGQQASAAVTVNSLQAALGELTVSPAIANLVSGQNLTLVPNANAASNAVNVTYTYATASAAIATVNGTGVVTAVAPGTTTITVTATGTGAGFSSATRTYGVTVNVSSAAPAISSLNVQPTSLSLATGSTGALLANATQPAGATAATYTYASANTAVATVTGTGANATVTAVAAGNTTITVTATAAAGGGFGASTVTQLIPVSVAAAASLTIETVTQGPIKTSYVDDSTSAGRRAGIVSEANGQVGQPIDITAVRDQIQVAVNLVTNGQRVDSIVAFIANADGTGRRAAARQLYSNGQANAGVVNLFVNTADFAANFETGEADVLYGNGQKVISASVFTTNGTAPIEIQNASNNRQVVNFANFDGYAIQYVNPIRVADGPAGLNWRGGPGEDGTGRFSIVPVWYSGKSVKSLTLGMRQGLMATIDICGAIGGTVPFSRETLTDRPFALTYNSANGRNVASSSAASTVGNGNIECGGYEHPAVTAQNIAAVVAGVDTENNPAPVVTFADGYRFSSTVARPVANRLDYGAPSTTAPNITRNLPAVTGWVNASFNFNTNTAASTDAGVGVAANSRTWSYNGCTTTTSTQLIAMADATGASIPECATNFLGGWDAANSTTRGPYRVSYSENDLLGNSGSSTLSLPFGVDKTVPLIRWSAASVADTTILAANSNAVQFQAEFIDERGGFIDVNDLGAPWRASSTSSGVITNSNGSQQHFASQAAGALIASSATTKAVCINPNNFTPIANSGVTSNAANIAGATGATFQTMPNCSFNTQPLGTLGTSPANDGYRSGNGATLAQNDGIYHYATRVYDRAGNVSEVLRRRLAVDAVAGTIANLGVPAIVTSTATPVLTYNAQDNVEIRATVVANQLPGIAEALVYPQQLVDARFNDNINSPIAGATTQLGVPAPVLLGVRPVFNAPVDLALAPASPIQTAFMAGFDVANRITPTITANYLTQGVPTLSAVPNASAFSSWTVLTSRAASFNAPEGLKAQLVSNTNITNSPFARVEFYRLTAGIPGATAPLNGNHWQYLGSSTTSLPADQGNTRYWTYTLPDNQYASLPNSFETQQVPAVIGNDIIAIGVLSNGSGFSTTSTIGGSAINFFPGSITFTAPPAGFPALPSFPQANITVAGGTQGFNAVVTGVGIRSVDAIGGTYTVTANPVTLNGVLYQPTNSVQVVNVPAGQTVLLPSAIVYQPQVLGVQITTNLPAGGNISVTLNGPVSVTATIPSNGAVIPVPQAGNYTVVAGTATLSIGNQTYNAPVVGGSPANVVAGVPPVATITYASPVFATGLQVQAYNNVTFGDFTTLTFLNALNITSNANNSPSAVPAASIGGAGVLVGPLNSFLQNSALTITNVSSLFTTASIPAGTLGNSLAGAVPQTTTFGAVYSPTGVFGGANGTLTMRPAQIRVNVTGVPSPALTNPTNWQLDATVTGPNLYTTSTFFSGANAFVVNGPAGAGSKIITVPVASPGVGSYQVSIPNTFVIGGTTFTAQCTAAATGGNTAQVSGANCLISTNAVYSAAQTITVNYTGAP